MSRLVRYTPRRVSPTGMLSSAAMRGARLALRAPYGSNRYRAAIKVGSFLYRNRGKIKKMKSLLNRRTAPGVKVQSKTAAHDPPVGSNSMILATLINEDLPWPARGTDGANYRDSNVIYVKGVKICRQFEYYIPSGSSNDIGPVTVHWCLLQLKNDETTGEVNQEIGELFFRDNSLDVRARNFNNSTATSTWDMGKNCLPLNPNYKVRILTHKRKTLIAKGGGQNNTSRGSFWNIDRYYPIKKRLSFRSGSSAAPNQKIFEVYWCEAKSDTSYPPLPNVWNGITRTRLHQLYFKDAC